VPTAAASLSSGVTPKLTPAQLPVLCHRYD
jgi:hypothetical protein